MRLPFLFGRCTLNTYVKPRAYGEPIHEDAPGFNPTVHRDLVEEINEALDKTVTRYLIGPPNASSDQYDYRRSGDSLECYDRERGAWRLMTLLQDNYRPGWMVDALVKNESSSTQSARALVKVEAVGARADGADLRVYALDSQGRFAEEVAHVITDIATGTEGNVFTLGWRIEGLTPGSTLRFAVTWGDDQAPAPRYTQQQYAAISKGASLESQRLGGYYLTTNREAAYAPLDTFATDGYQIFGQRDDSGAELALPLGASVQWNGRNYTRLGHNSNGGIEFGTAGSSRPSAGPESIGWSAYDIYESWRREVILPDGMAWHILTGTSGYTANIKLTVRYFNTGRWVVTLFHNAAPVPSSVTVYAGGQALTLSAPQAPREDVPSTWFVVEIDAGTVRASAGGRSAITGGRAPGGGLRPLYADSVLTPSGNVQREIDELRGMVEALQRAPQPPGEDLTWFMGGS